MAEDIASPRRTRPLHRFARILLALAVAVVCALLYWALADLSRDLLFPYVKRISLEEHLILRRLAVWHVCLPLGLLGALALSHPLVRLFGKWAPWLVVLIFLPLFWGQVLVYMFASTVRPIVKFGFVWHFITMFLPLFLGVAVVRRLHSGRSRGVRSQGPCKSS